MEIKLVDADLGIKLLNDMMEGKELKEVQKEIKSADKAKRVFKRRKLTVDQVLLINEILNIGHRNDYWVNGYFLTYDEAYEIIRATRPEQWSAFTTVETLKTCDNVILKKVETAGNKYIIPCNDYLLNSGLFV